MTSARVFPTTGFADLGGLLYGLRAVLRLRTAQEDKSYLSLSGDADETRRALQRDRAPAAGQVPSSARPRSASRCAHDRRSKARTAVAPGAPRVRPREALERGAGTSPGRPGPGRGPRWPGKGRPHGQRSRRCPRRGEPERVVNQVVHGLADTVRVEPWPRDRRVRHLDGDTGRPGAPRGVVRAAGQQRADAVRSRRGWIRSSSLRARNSSCSVMRASRAVSSPACSTAAASSSRLRPGRAASSSSPRSTANGVRSSWLASATSARCRAGAPRAWPADRSWCVASAAISSRVRGTWRPGAGSRAETAATSRRSRSTGDRAARASP